MSREQRGCFSPLERANQSWQQWDRGLPEPTGYGATLSCCGSSAHTVCRRAGLFFFALALFGFSCLSSLGLFAKERVLFMRERCVVQIPRHARRGVPRGSCRSPAELTGTIRRSHTSPRRYVCHNRRLWRDFWRSLTRFGLPRVQVLFDIVPLRVVPPLVFGGIVYGLVGLVPNVAAFWKFMLALVLFNLTTASVCLLLSVAFADTGVASLVGTLVMLFK